MTDPSALYRYRDSLAAVDLLGAAIAHLDFFSWLERSPADAKTICSGLSLHERPTDVMLTLFAANSLVTCDTRGTYCVTELAREFLTCKSPYDARSYYNSMADRQGVHDFLKVLRTGKPANWPGKEGEANWHAAMKTESFSESFTAAMDCRGRVLGPALSRAVNLASSKRLLDIAGGSGVYSVALVEANPALNAVVFEASPIDAIARRTISSASLCTRIDVVSGDMFTDPWPADCDTHLFSNVLHDWDLVDVDRLLIRSAESLPSHGRILVHDMFLNPDKCGPLAAAEYSALLMSVTQGRIYSTSEIGSRLERLGFTVMPLIPTALHRGVLVATRGDG